MRTETIQCKNAVRCNYRHYCPFNTNKTLHVVTREYLQRILETTAPLKIDLQTGFVETDEGQIYITYSEEEIAIKEYSKDDCLFTEDAFNEHIIGATKPKYKIDKWK